MVTAYACLRDACEAEPDPEMESLARELAALVDARYADAVGDPVQAVNHLNIRGAIRVHHW